MAAAAAAAAREREAEIEREIEDLMGETAIMSRCHPLLNPPALRLVLTFPDSFPPARLKVKASDRADPPSAATQVPRRAIANAADLGQDCSPPRRRSHDHLRACRTGRGPHGQPHDRGQDLADGSPRRESLSPPALILSLYMSLSLSQRSQACGVNVGSAQIHAPLSRKSRQCHSPPPAHLPHSTLGHAG